MLEGVLIFLAGVVLGYILCIFTPKKEPPKKLNYDKYKNQDGLYSRRVMMK